MKRDKIILIGLFVMVFSMALLGGCGSSDESIGSNKVESESELSENGSEELDVTETKDVTETETEVTTEIESSTEEGTSSELVEDTEQDTSADTELGATDTEKEESNLDKNEGATDNTNNPSNNPGGGSGSGNSTDSNTGTPSAGNNTGNSGNTNNDSGNTTTNKPSGDSNTGSNGSANANTNTNTGSNNGSTDTGNSTESNDTAPSTPVPQTSKEAFDLINEERVKLGLEPAVWDEECERIALIRAQEIYDLGSKISSEAHDGFWDFWFENPRLSECVAWGYASAEGVVYAWMDSDEHRDTLMAERYTYLAVARCGGRWVAVNRYV